MLFFEDTIVKPFLNCLKAYPNKNAFCINDKYYTYYEFGIIVKNIRYKIQDKDSNIKIFGLIANDDIQTYATIFALWLEGLSFVPLHPSHPIDRNADIIRDVGIKIVFDSSSNLISFSSEILIIQTHDLPKVGFIDDKFKICPDDALAYILFTSGSTGKPKGVMISRKNLGSFLQSFWDTSIKISSDDRCLQSFDLTFDVSIQSFLIALTRGACVYTVPVGITKYIYVAGLFAKYKLTCGAFAPSMLNLLKPYFNEIDASSLKYCIITAEACPLSLLEEWSFCAKNAIIYDFYGPTEATIYCTYYLVAKSCKTKSANGIVAIGKPLSNITCVLLDDNDNVLGRNIKGELCVAGSQITPGYWKDNERNEVSFLTLNLRNNLLRFYRTGDICYQDDDGDIMYIGRKDTQVKIQGYRIELGEIEYYAREFLKKSNVVVITNSTKSNDLIICMLIESEQFVTTDLLNYLSSKLPVYMLPTRIIFLPSFPLNTNEKLDRVALKNILHHE